MPEVLFDLILSATAEKAVKLCFITYFKPGSHARGGKVTRRAENKRSQNDDRGKRWIGQVFLNYICFFSLLYCSEVRFEFFMPHLQAVVCMCDLTIAANLSGTVCPGVCCWLVDFLTNLK